MAFCKVTSVVIFLLHVVASHGATTVIEEARCAMDPDCNQGLNNHGVLTDDSNKNKTFREGIIAEASYQNPSPPISENNGGLGADLGEVQVIDESYAEEIVENISEARTYIRDIVNNEEKYIKVRESCKNNHEMCSFWSVIGECDANPGYMKVNCAPACKSCEMLHVETRCPMDPNAVDALYPGDLDKMFENIITNPEFQKFEPIVLSRPPEGPWMVMFENAISKEESERLIQLGGNQGYERSSDVGEEKADGTYTAFTNEGRTSTNAWCVGACYEDPIAKRIMLRIANITGIPEENSENLQLLRYDQTQFYQTHNDFIPYQVDRPTGVRILTFYMYLNDVEEGGGTNFPNLGKTVTPKRGRAVLWPSVLNDDPNTQDSRTNHQALPVIKGIKYGANAWIHQRDYKTNNQKGC